MKFGKITGEGIETLSANAILIDMSELRALRSIKEPATYKIGAITVIVEPEPKRQTGEKHKPVEAK